MAGYMKTILTIADRRPLLPLHTAPDSHCVCVGHGRLHGNYLDHSCMSGG